MQDLSPWVQIDEEVFIIPGIDLISTPSHGGARVTRNAAMLLSPEARKCGFWEDGYFWFEEDCCEQVVLRELIDQKQWTPPADRIKDPAAFEDSINRVIQAYHPDYWKAREKRLNALPKKTRQRSHSR